MKRLNLGLFAASLVALAAAPGLVLAADPPAPAPAPADAPPPAAAPSSSGGLETDHKAALDTLSAKSEELQKAIARIGEKVMLLRESVVLDLITPTWAIVAFQNEAGNSFTLDRAVFSIDGQEVLTKQNKDGVLNNMTQFDVLNGPMKPGEHEVSVSLAMVGTGIGRLPDLKGYKFDLDSKYKFTVSEGRLTRVAIVPIAKMDAGMAPKDRLAVKYDVEVTLSNEAKPANK